MVNDTITVIGLLAYVGCCFYNSTRHLTFTLLIVAVVVIVVDNVPSLSIVNPSTCYICCCCLSVFPFPLSPIHWDYGYLTCCHPYLPNFSQVVDSLQLLCFFWFSFLFMLSVCLSTAELSSMVRSRASNSIDLASNVKNKHLMQTPKFVFCLLLKEAEE